MNRSTHFTVIKHKKYSEGEGIHFIVIQLKTIRWQRMCINEINNRKTYVSNVIDIGDQGKTVDLNSRNIRLKENINFPVDVLRTTFCINFALPV